MIKKYIYLSLMIIFLNNYSQGLENFPGSNASYRNETTKEMLKHQTTARIQSNSIQAQFYVSPVGSGSICSFEAPCALSEVQRKVRHINRNMAGDIVIDLRGGLYYLQNTYGLRGVDSASNGYRIIYQAYPGETPVIDGGTNLTNGWSMYDSAKGIYKKTGIGFEFRQLYVNGKRAIRAREPDLDEGDELTRGPYYVANSPSDSFTPYPYPFDAAYINTWANHGDAELVWISHWTARRARIDSYSTSHGVATLTLKNPENNNRYLGSPKQDPMYFYFENHLDLLDIAGEWYLNVVNDTLYYKPREGEVMNSVEVIAPRLERLITLYGSQENWVSNITISGLTFRHSNYSLPNQCGFISIQAMYLNDSCDSTASAGDGKIPGMVEFKYTNNILFESNVLELGGGHGLVTWKPTASTEISRNILSNLAGGGMWIGDGQPSDSEDAVIRDNVIDHIGLDYTEAVGIVAGKPLRILITHNEVKNTPYTGISIGWQWTAEDQGSSDNEVSYNKIHDVMELHDDGACIYSLGSMPGTRIHHNYCYHVSSSPYRGVNPVAGIYLDQGSTGKTVDHNVIEVTPKYSNDGSFFTNSPPNTPVRENVFEDNYYRDPKGTILVPDNKDVNNILAESSWKNVVFLSSGIQFNNADDWLRNAGQGSTYSIGDFNGDGKDDLLFAYLNGTNAVALSTGSGFKSPSPWLTDVGQENAYSIGDFNGDGKDDLLFAYQDGANWYNAVALSTGSGFNNPIRWLTNTGKEATYQVGDFNGTGRDDLLFAYRYKLNWSATVALSNGSGFKSPSQWLMSLRQELQSSCYAGDFNGDGKDDLLFVDTDRVNWHNAVALSTGTGFNDADYWLKNAEQETNHVGDFNGDGKDDLLFAYSDGVSWRNTVALSTGSGFKDPSLWLIGMGRGTTYHIGDFNGDGKDDILFSYNMDWPSGAQKIIDESGPANP